MPLKGLESGAGGTRLAAGCNFSAGLGAGLGPGEEVLAREQLEALEL